MRNRRFVSWLIVGVILILMAWSSANIAEMASHYHPGYSTWLLGLAFGVGNAIAVFAWATARQKLDRTPAIVGAIVFGLGSAIIQINLYLIYGAPLPVAIAYGALGPAGEAILAWLDASVRMADEQAQIAENERAERRRQDAERRKMTPAKMMATTAPNSNGVTSILAEPVAILTGLQSALTEAPTPDASAIPPDAGNLTNRQRQAIAQVLTAVRQGQIGSDGDLAQALGVPASTARRYRTWATEIGAIQKNGDGRYHALPN